MKTKSAQRAMAITRIEVLVILAVTSFLTVVLLVGLVALPEAFRKAPRVNCLNNLGVMGKSFQLWAFDHNGKMPMAVSLTNGGTLELVMSGQVSPHFRTLSNELLYPRALSCPADNERRSATNWGPDFDDSKISYCIGVDADETRPSMVLSGDRNVTQNGATLRGLISIGSNSAVGWSKALHTESGNILLADGSVHITDPTRLRDILVRNGVTNRLLFP